MASPPSTPPRGTRTLVKAILAALEAVPEVNRKAAFRHASMAVREKLIAQSEKAKAASRQAPAVPGAKRRAAVAAIRGSSSLKRPTRAKAAPEAPAGRARRSSVLLPGGT
ncbi:hypothetical protein QMO56_00785 [Roseomonas sp. E05]|uniref:hypothetical protein n=1 Tax=Roseomonas sp. E05 TaxID=3046310 RepID=UPI0024B9C9B6|nr:hypothetical protein [Roseomonas sp. E05]MDJ0386633.1 hypothetical protein [Roseomonas sp. E05]